MNIGIKPNFQPVTDYAKVNGTCLYFEIAGEGSPLVLIHGFSLDTRMWDDQFEIFSNYYKVVRYDVRGFGKSAFPTDAIYTSFEDLKGLLDYLSIEHSHILGFSMGGAIAINFALEFPELVDSLIIVGSDLSGYDYKYNYNVMFEKGKEAGVEAARELWLSSLFLKSAFKNSTVSPRLRKIISDYSGWHWVNETPVRSLDPPAIQRLEQITSPTLAIVGELEIPDSQTITNIVHKRIPDARKVVLTNVGHFSSMEDPERFNQTVLAFLSGRNFTT